jgi:hypothetical protein
MADFAPGCAAFFGGFYFIATVPSEAVHIFTFNFKVYILTTLKKYKTHIDKQKL